MKAIRVKEARPFEVNKRANKAKHLEALGVMLKPDKAYLEPIPTSVNEAVKLMDAMDNETQAAFNALRGL